MLGVPGSRRARAPQRTCHTVRVMQRLGCMRPMPDSRGRIQLAPGIALPGELPPRRRRSSSLLIMRHRSRSSGSSAELQLGDERPRRVAQVEAGHVLGAAQPVPKRVRVQQQWAQAAVVNDEMVAQSAIARSYATHQC